MMIANIRCLREKKIEVLVAKDLGNPNSYDRVEIAEISVEQAKELIIKLAIAIDIVEKDKRRNEFV